MAIEIRAGGEAQAAAKAGQQIGQAQAAKREQEISLQQQAEDRARAWEVEKFVLNSQQDFAHEQRLRQDQLNREARAHEWETEKMEMASRLDFEQEERDRLKYKAEYRAGHDSIRNNQNLTDAQKDQADFLLSMQYIGKGVEEAAVGLGLKQTQGTQRPQTIGQYRREAEALVGKVGESEDLQSLQQRVIDAGYNPDTLQPIQETAAPSYPGREQVLGMGTNVNIPGAPPEQFPSVFNQPPEEERIRVIAPDGRIGTILKSEANSPEYKDYKVIGQNAPAQATTVPENLGKFYGIPHPLAALWDYTQINRRLQMAKMLKEKESRAKMSWTEKIGR